MKNQHLSTYIVPILITYFFIPLYIFHLSLIILLNRISMDGITVLEMKNNKID